LPGKKRKKKLNEQSQKQEEKIKLLNEEKDTLVKQSRDAENKIKTQVKEKELLAIEMAQIKSNVSKIEEQMKKS